MICADLYSSNDLRRANHASGFRASTKAWPRDSSPYTLQTMVLSPNTTHGLLARGLFDTGADVELVSRDFIEYNGLASLVTSLNSSQAIIGLGGGQVTAIEEVNLK